MITKIVKNQTIYEIDWIEIWEGSIKHYLKTRYGLTLDDTSDPSNVRVRVVSKANAMIDPTTIQIKMPELIDEQKFTIDDPDLMKGD